MINKSTDFIIIKKIKYDQHTLPTFSIHVCRHIFMYYCMLRDIFVFINFLHKL